MEAAAREEATAVVVRAEETVVAEMEVEMVAVATVAKGAPSGATAAVKVAAALVVAAREARAE